MAKRFIVQPPFDGDVTVGGRGTNIARLTIGRLAESGSNRNVFLDVAKEFVLLILGKRGSGKSYTLGNVIEGLAAAPDNSEIAAYASGQTRPAVLLLDPLMNFWTTAIAAAEAGPRKVRDAYQALQDWDMSPVPVNTSLWMPAGFHHTTDYPAIREFRIRAEDLDAGDWADLCSVNLIREPQGILLSECWYSVVQEGYDGVHGSIPANPAYTVLDLVAYLDCLLELGGHDHSRDTVRALRRTLQGYARLPLFSGAGTPLTQLLQPGIVSVLMLSPRVNHDLRRVITRMLIRRILRERENACHIQQRLSMETLSVQVQADLEHHLATLVPKTILAIDEAQELLGEEGGEARSALEEFCLQGRNYGLSLILATQRPTTTAISAKVRSQADTYFIHRLLTEDDIGLVQKNLLSVMPSEIRDGDRPLAFSELIRSLHEGQCLVTSSNIRAGNHQGAGRTFLLNVRPRVCVHGGEVE
jgi:uncharacterized protein